MPHGYPKLTPTKFEPTPEGLMPIPDKLVLNYFPILSPSEIKMIQAICKGTYVSKEGRPIGLLVSKQEFMELLSMNESVFDKARKRLMDRELITKRKSPSIQKTIRYVYKLNYKKLQ